VGCHDAIGIYINYCLHLQRPNRQRKCMVVKKSCHLFNIILTSYLKNKVKMARYLTSWIEPDVSSKAAKTLFNIWIQRCHDVRQSHSIEGWRYAQSGAGVLEEPEPPIITGLEESFESSPISPLGTEAVENSAFRQSFYRLFDALFCAYLPEAEAIGLNHINKDFRLWAKSRFIFSKYLIDA